MEDRSVVTPDYVPPEWVAAQPFCVCGEPVPELRAERKGAARSYCAHCGLPIRLDFGSR
jgi:hypothetical protein